MNVASFDLSNLMDLLQKSEFAPHKKSGPLSLGRILSGNGFTPLKGGHPHENIWAKLADILNSDIPAPEKNALMESLLSESTGVLGNMLEAMSDTAGDDRVQVTGAVWPPMKKTPVTDPEVQELADIPVSPEAIVPNDPTQITEGGVHGAENAALAAEPAGQAVEEILLVSNDQSQNPASLLSSAAENKSAAQPPLAGLPGAENVKLDEVPGGLQRHEAGGMTDAPEVKGAKMETISPVIEKTVVDDKTETERSPLKGFAESDSRQSLSSQWGRGADHSREESPKLFDTAPKPTEIKTEANMEKFHVKTEEGVSNRATAAANMPMPEERQPSSVSGEEGLRSHALNHASPRVQAPAPASAVQPAPEPLPERFQTDVINQIVEKATLQRNKDQSEIRIQLKPEFLGNIRLNISANNQQVMVKVLTDHPAVKEILETNLSQLKAELQHHGLQVDKFDVQVGPDSGHNGQGRGQNAHRPMFGRSDTPNPGNDQSEKHPNEGKRRQAYGHKSDRVDYFA